MTSWTFYLHVWHGCLCWLSMAKLHNFWPKVCRMTIDFSAALVMLRVKALLFGMSERHSIALTILFGFLSQKIVMPRARHCIQTVDVCQHDFKCWNLLLRNRGHCHEGIERRDVDPKYFTKCTALEASFNIHHHHPLLDRLQAQHQRLLQLLYVARSVKWMRPSMQSGQSACAENIRNHITSSDAEKPPAPRCSSCWAERESWQATIMQMRRWICWRTCSSMASFALRSLSDNSWCNRIRYSTSFKNTKRFSNTHHSFTPTILHTTNHLTHHPETDSIMNLGRGGRMGLCSGNDWIRYEWVAVVDCGCICLLLKSTYDTLECRSGVALD